MTTAGQATSPHGTRARYVGGCHDCEPCRAANREWARTYARQRVQRAHGALPPAFVDAEPARRHVRALMAAGMGRRTVVARSGVATSVVSNLLYGRPGRRPSKRISPGTEAKLMAVALVHADHACIDATGSLRRLRALVTIGWSQRQLAERLGMSEANFSMLMRQDQVTAIKARRIRALYEELWDQLPPTGTRYAAAAVTRAQRMAREAGWAPPMAWDDDAIDDPTAEPDIGERGSTVLDLDEVAHLVRGGCSLQEAARRMGVTVGAIERAQARTKSNTQTQVRGAA